VAGLLQLWLGGCRQLGSSAAAWRPTHQVCRGCAGQAAGLLLAGHRLRPSCCCCQGAAGACCCWAAQRQGKGPPAVAAAAEAAAAQGAAQAGALRRLHGVCLNWKQAR
jgi:hypothetical protein